MVGRIDAHHHAKFSGSWSFEFLRWPPPPFWIFEFAKFYWLLGWRGSRRIEHAKFCQNRSIGCKDIKIFRFFKMAAAIILNCWICKILLADDVRRGNTHHCTKYRQNNFFLLRRYCNISNFQNGRRHHLGFLKSWILLNIGLERVETHEHAKFR